MAHFKGTTPPPLPPAPRRSKHGLSRFSWRTPAHSAQSETASVASSLESDVRMTQDVGSLLWRAPELARGSFLYGPGVCTRGAVELERSDGAGYDVDLCVYTAVCVCVCVCVCLYDCVCSLHGPLTFLTRAGVLLCLHVVLRWVPPDP